MILLQTTQPLFYSSSSHLAHIRCLLRCLLPRSAHYGLSISFTKSAYLTFPLSSTVTCSSTLLTSSTPIVSPSVVNMTLISFSVISPFSSRSNTLKASRSSFSALLAGLGAERERRLRSAAVMWSGLGQVEHELGDLIVERGERREESTG